LENLDKIEAQLERVTTVADKLDATLKNLNVTLDKTDSIFKSSTDAVANLIIATDQVNTNIGVINKAAKFTNSAVVRIGRLCDRLFSIDKATQTDINTVPSPEDFNIACPLEVSELFHKYPILPSSFIIIATTILAIHLLYKMYHDRDTRKLNKGGGGSILQRFFLAVRVRRERFIPTFRSTWNHIHKLK
jgi:hypothetical protein